MARVLGFHKDYASLYVIVHTHMQIFLIHWESLARISWTRLTLWSLPSPGGVCLSVLVPMRMSVATRAAPLAWTAAWQSWMAWVTWDQGPSRFVPYPLRPKAQPGSNQSEGKYAHWSYCSGCKNKGSMTCCICLHGT
jgi:hypothetical protein